MWADCPEHFTGIHNEDSPVLSSWSPSHVTLRTPTLPECPVSLEVGLSYFCCHWWLAGQGLSRSRHQVQR